MTARLALAAYLVAVVAIGFVHDPLWLAVLLLVALPLGGHRFWRPLRRALLAVFVFAGVVSVAYALSAAWRGEAFGTYLLRFNLRVLLLTYLGFVLIYRVNLFQALSFSPALSYLLTLTYSQVLTLRRVLADFRLALRSRTLSPPPLRRRYAHSGVLVNLLLRKALWQSGEIGSAMRSRGFFND